MKARDLAELTGGTLLGDPEREVLGVAEPSSAGSGDLVFLLDEAKLRESKGKRFCTVITTLSPEGINAEAIILVPDGRLAMARALRAFKETHLPRPGIHPDAFVEEDVLLGEGVRVGAFAYIATEASVGRGSVVYSNCYIGRGARIGDECVIMPGAYIGDLCEIGSRVLVGPNAVIGYEGFGFVQTEEGFLRIPQVGRVVIEDDCEIGACACIDRATVGETRIARGTKIDNLVQVGHNVRIGDGTAIAAQAGIAGSSTLGRRVLLGGQVGIADHLAVGDGAIITAKSGVSSNVPSGAIYSSGVPARERALFLKCMALFYKLPEIYERLRRLEDASEDPKKRDQA
ncbi:MAG: UDP-3-O-(3-hydroxymyristoyl)glucosamine N-acyltransferase [candidate division WOR-3 bacterium]